MNFNILPLWGHRVYCISVYLINENVKMLLYFGHTEKLGHFISFNCNSYIKYEDIYFYLYKHKITGKLSNHRNFEVCHSNSLPSYVFNDRCTFKDFSFIRIHAQMHKCTNAHAQYAKALKYHVKYFNLYLSNSFLRVSMSINWDLTDNFLLIWKSK